MSVYLSKILSLAIYPLTWIFVLLFIGLIFLAIKSHRAAAVTFSLSFIAFWIMAMPMTGQWLTHSLESQYEAKDATSYQNADVIILLGGGMAGSAPPARLNPDLNDAADRVWFAAQLYHAKKAPYIIASGGTLTWHGTTQSEARAMRLFLEQLGVPATAIIDEEQSRTTYKNALNCRSKVLYLEAKRILLVTSAAHLPRAMAVFQKLYPESEIIPVATDVRVIEVGEDLLDWLPQAGGIGMLTEAWHEWLGLLIYRLKGQA
jgi:uncharacterized SAM-binding protein YcdF (DUF218 family)